MQTAKETALSALDPKARFRAAVPRNALIDISESVRTARSSAAKRALFLGLQGGAAAQLTGYEAHKVMELRLAAIARSYGGAPFDGGLFPRTSLRNFQMMADFDGVLIVRASIVEVWALPTRSTTRVNGSTLNWPYSKQTELYPREHSVDPPMLALLLTCRDKEVRGRYHEVAIAAMEPDHGGFIFYENVDSFIAGYESHDSGDATPDKIPTSRPQGPLPMTLRNPRVPFVGGEHPDVPDDKEETSPS